MRLEPVVEWIGGACIEHGERGHELDPDYPEACLCGGEVYWQCEGWLFGENTIGGVTVSIDDNGRIVVEGGAS